MKACRYFLRFAHERVHPLLLTVLMCCVPAASAQSPEAQRHFTNGRALFEEHDDSGEALREAETEFREALRLAPKYAAAQAYLGFIAEEDQKFEQAEAAFRQALTWDSRCAEALVGLARLELRQSSRRSAALNLMRRAVKAAPRNVLAHRELGYFLTSNAVAPPTAEMWREAIASFTVLTKLDKNDRDAHYQLGLGYRALSRWPEAEREFREVLRIGQTPDDSDVWVYSVHADLGEALARQGKNEQAIREYEALIASQGAGEEEIANARRAINTLRRPAPRQ